MSAGYCNSSRCAVTGGSIGGAKDICIGSRDAKDHREITRVRRVAWFTVMVINEVLYVVEAIGREVDRALVSIYNREHRHPPRCSSSNECLLKASTESME